MSRVPPPRAIVPLRLVAQGLLGLFGLLAEQPMMARLRHEFVPPIRLYPYKAHMIAYLEEGADILIVRILHGRQDWDRYLR